MFMCSHLLPAEIDRLVEAGIIKLSPGKEPLIDPSLFQQIEKLREVLPR
jgi:hypothetical protein